MTILVVSGSVQLRRRGHLENKRKEQGIRDKPSPPAPQRPLETKSLSARPPVFTRVLVCSVVFTHDVHKLAVLPI